MHLRVAALVLSALAGVASADPMQRCRELPAKPYAKLAPEVQSKLSGTRGFEARRDWPKLIVMVDISRAPHIARQILTDCPGVAVLETTPLDARRFESEIRLHVTSYAAIERLAQLPAVAYISVADPTIRIKHPMPDIDFE